MSQKAKKPEKQVLKIEGDAWKAFAWLISVSHRHQEATKELMQAKQAVGIPPNAAFGLNEREGIVEYVTNGSPASVPD